MKKAILAVVTALPDMQGHIRQDNPCSSRHGKHNGQDRSGLTGSGSVPELVRAPSPNYRNGAKSRAVPSRSLTGSERASTSSMVTGRAVLMRACTRPAMRAPNSTL